MVSLKEVILKELSKVTGELKDFRQDFDVRLTPIDNTIEGIEKILSQMQKKVHEVQQEVKQVATETGKVKTKVQSLGTDVEQLEDDYDYLQQTVENIDNNLRKNDAHLKGLKEEIDGNNLRLFLEEAIIGLLGADNDLAVQVSSAFRIGVKRNITTRTRDVSKLADKV